MTVHRSQKIHMHTLGIVTVLIIAWMSVGISRSVYADTNIIYVNAAVTTGEHTGTSWDDAYTDLQDALQEASAGQAIWVAAGTYTPVRCAPSCTIIDRRASFMLKDGVAIYGGFVGGRVSPDKRNVTANVTILSGDLLRDDSASSGTGENSLHVVRAIASGRSTILDGFTITSGNDNTDYDFGGGGMLNLGGSATLSNITFSNNYAYQGGGMYNLDSSPTLTNVSFSNNVATKDGGGMYNNNSNPTLTNVTFTSNTAATQGGGMINYGSSPTLTNVSFSSNSALDGGGMVNDQSSPTLTNVSFRNNVASGGRGGGMFNDQSSATLTNVSFRNNVASGGRGGGMFNDQSSATLTNATFSGNKSSYGGGMFNDQSSPTLTNATFSGNSAIGHGGGMFNNNSHPTIRNSIFWNDFPNEISNPITVSFSIVQGAVIYPGTGNLNVDPLFVAPVPAAPNPGGDLRLRFGSPAIDAGNNQLSSPALSATDLDGKPRRMDVPTQADTGIGEVPVVDLGAYEVQGILFVNRAATGRNTGATWADAYPSLQAALEQARAGQSIWVAKGTYTPVNCAPTCNKNPDNRQMSFMLKNGVSIYGGFAGGETRLEQRDLATNPTTLSGDLLDDDAGKPAMGENSFHVVRTSYNETSAILDGFTITGGNATGTEFLDFAGGGVSNLGGSPTLSNLILSGNRAQIGAGMHNFSSSPTLTNVTFSGNQANAGGGMYSYNSSPTMTNAIFSGNTAQTCGGGIYNVSSSPTLTNATLSGNVAGNGGAICNIASQNVQIRNSILWANQPDELLNDETSSATVEFSLVQGNYASNLNADPQFLTPVPAAPSTGGDLRLSFGSPAIGGASSAVCPAADRDGKPRPSPAGSACDMGSYESDLEATTTSLNIAPNPSVNGQPVTLQARVQAVAPGIRVPSGLVQFYSRDTALGAPVVLNAKGVARLEITTLPVGTHAISATYLGDHTTFFNPSIAVPISQTVYAYSASNTIVATAGTPQTAVFGTPFATALQAHVVNASGNGVAGVTVVFSAPSDGGYGAFVGGMASASATTDSAGVATAPEFTAGTHTKDYTLTATASGVATPALFRLKNQAPPPTPAAPADVIPTP